MTDKLYFGIEYVSIPCGTIKRVISEQPPPPDAEFQFPVVQLRGAIVRL